MPTEENTNQQIEEISNPTIGGERPAQIQQGGVDVKLGQLEVTLSSLKEKIEGDFGQLSQRVKSSLEDRKWITLAALTFLGIAVAIAIGITNLMTNSLNSQRDIQKDYYQELINQKSELSERKIEINNLQNELNNIKIRNPYLK